MLLNRPSRKGHGRTGRPPGTVHMLTLTVQEKICAALRIAVPAKYAAEAEGISEGTFYEWLRKGAKGIQPYHDFSSAVTRATAQAVCNLTARALAGGPGAWQATWLLERRFRSDYGPHVLVGGAPKADPIKIEGGLAMAAMVRSSPEALRQLHAAIATAIAEASAPGRNELLQ